jgi:hypothetical protein
VNKKSVFINIFFLTLLIPMIAIAGPRKANRKTLECGGILVSAKDLNLLGVGELAKISGPWFAQLDAMKPSIVESELLPSGESRLLFSHPGFKLPQEKRSPSVKQPIAVKNLGRVEIVAMEAAYDPEFEDSPVLLISFNTADGRGHVHIYRQNGELRGEHTFPRRIYSALSGENHFSGQHFFFVLYDPKGAQYSFGTLDFSIAWKKELLEVQSQVEEMIGPEPFYLDASSNYLGSFGEWNVVLLPKSGNGRVRAFNPNGVEFTPVFGAGRKEIEFNPNVD